MNSELGLMGQGILPQSTGTCELPYRYQEALQHMVEEMQLHGLFGQEVRFVPE